MSDLDPVQQNINDKLGVKSKNVLVPIPSTKPAQPQLSQASIRQLVPEESKPLWASAKIQIFAVCGTFIVLAFLVKQFVFGGKTATTPADSIQPVTAATAVDCSSILNKDNPFCTPQLLAKSTAQNNLRDPSLYVKPAPSPKPPTAKNTLPITKIPVRQDPPVVYPQRTFTQSPPAFQRSVSQQSYREPIVQPPQFVQPVKPKTDSETLWRQLSTDGITIAQGNTNNFTPSSSNTDVSYVSESQPVSLVSGSSFAPPQQSSDPSFASTPIQQGGQVVASGEGKLIDSIVWAQDFDISGQEYPIQITKPIGNLSKGAIVYVQLDGGATSSSGLINLRPVRSDQGDVSGLRIAAKSGAPLQAKIKGRGGNNFLSTVGQVLLGGVQVAANQALSNSDDVLSSVGSGITSSAISSVRGNMGNNRNGRQSFFEITKGTIVKISSY